MTADELHAAVRAALDRAGHAIADATGLPWHIGDAVDPLTPCNLHAFPSGHGVADGVSWLDAHLIAATVNNASAALRGARRIIERHHPHLGDCCVVCWENDNAETGGFPCADYQDAAAGVPNLPGEVSRALRQ